MSIQNKYRLPLAVVVGAGFVFSGSLAAQEVFESTNGAISFGEFDGGREDIVYYVDVLAPISLHAVAFSFEETGFPDGGEIPPGDFPPGGDLGGEMEHFGFATFAPWNSIVLSEEQWNLGTGLPIAGNFVDSAGLGSFDSLFGAMDDSVIVYYDFSGDHALDEDNDVDEADWLESPASFIRGFGVASTEGLFFDNTGAVVGATVPEPSVSLFAGLGVLGCLARRRRA